MASSLGHENFVGSGGEDEGGLGAEGFGVAVEALVEVDGGGEALLQHGALLTSIPGIGFVLAAGIAGELGEPRHLAKTVSD